MDLIYSELFSVFKTRLHVPHSYEEEWPRASQRVSNHIGTAVCRSVQMMTDMWWSGIKINPLVPSHLLFLYSVILGMKS